jgi:sulfide:quinone oxidoreductase
MIEDSSKEDLRFWILKKYMLPYLYWNKMMKGIEVLKKTEVLASVFSSS